MAGSSREAYAMTSRGTRKPAVSSSTTASGLPRWASASSQLPRRPRRRALREVAQHRRRTGRAAAAHRAVLHRRQVLRLVEDDMAQRVRTRHQVGRLVDQHRVRRRPPAPTSRCAAGLAHRIVLLLVVA